MPYFYVDEDELEIDIEPGDYLDACSQWDIEKLIQYLIEDGYIKNPYVKRTDNVSINEESFNKSLDILSANYVNLTLEEEELINNIAKRFP